jgi:small GTP-binding protein
MTRSSDRTEKVLTRKLVVLGEPGVGKTSLVRRHVLREFRGDYQATLGADFYSKTIGVPRPNTEGGPVEMRMMIWDIEGDYGPEVFRTNWIKGASAALVVADLTRRHTQDTMLTLAALFDETFRGRPITLVLNKVDLVPEGSEPQLSPELRSSRWQRVIRTSAKSGAEVDRAFEATAAEIVRRGW